MTSCVVLIFHSGENLYNDGHCVCVCVIVFLYVLEKLSAERVKQVMEHIWRMQEFCNSMNRVSPDAYEYAYLKATVLFSPGNRAFHAQAVTLFFMHRQFFYPAHNTPH